MKKKTSADDFAEVSGCETRESSQDGALDPSARPGCLVFISVAGPGDQGRSVPLGAVDVVIGRSRECELTLRDESISRRHVRLCWQADGILVEDLGSKNGVTYLGKRIGQAVLSVGSRMGMGDCYVDFLPLPGAGTVPVSTLECYGDLVGSSLPMRRLYAVLEAMERSDAPVLIEGETGTGKELVARALHTQGGRAAKPFVVIDCGSLPARLMESELFGYRKGAFTGAAADHAGAFEAAAGGTVFLDEIDDLPLDLQPKLLRVLETNQVKRLGDVDYLPVDVRIIVASKNPLAGAVEAGRFRRDLFYRIAVVQLTLPPLRDRREDIPVLVDHLARKLSEGQAKNLPPETVESFMALDWTGNVRELRNAVQRTLALGLGLAGSMTAATTATETPAGYRERRKQVLQDFDVAFLTDLMSRHGGNLSAAARDAGISRNYLRDLLRRHGLYAS